MRRVVGVGLPERFFFFLGVAFLLCVVVYTLK